MGVITRGVRNAFRNGIRTFSVIFILALSIGLALVMLLSYKTVQDKIASVKSSVGNTITVSPAGARGFEGGGEPLTQDEVATIKTLAHVSSVTQTLNDRLTPDTDTSLASAIDPGSLGVRFNGGGANNSSSNTPARTGGTTRTIKLPITVTGVDATSSFTSGSTKLTSGEAFDANSDQDVAVVGADLATKNSLTVGSTFTGYSGATIKVVGIFDAGNKFANSGIYMPIKAVQRLSSQSGQISSAEVTVDTLTNVDGVVASIKNAIGSDKADVTSNADSASSVLTPLENIRNISLYSLIGALVAGAVITLLTMMMIVRERRREIGVLKAIGSSNVGVVMQFVTESLVLTLLGALVGIVLGIACSNPVLNALVNNNESSSTSGPGPGNGPGGFRQAIRLGGQIGGGVQNALHDLHAVVGTDIILYGVGAAFLIAIIGSAVPAWLIAKVKPAEVMRAE